MVDDHRQADPRLPEQCRSAVSGCAKPARLRLHTAAPRHCPAVCDRQDHGQRAARRVDRIRERLEFRVRIEHHLAQRSQHVRGLRRLRDHDAGEHDRLVYLEHAKLAQGADLQRGRHADVEQGCAHDPDRWQRVHLERVILRPDHGPRHHARVQPGLRSGGGLVQHDEFPRRLQRPADGGA